VGDGTHATSAMSRETGMFVSYDASGKCSRSLRSPRLGGWWTTGRGCIRSAWRHQRDVVDVHAVRREGRDRVRIEPGAAVGVRDLEDGLQLGGERGLRGAPPVGDASKVGRALDGVPVRDVVDPRGRSRRHEEHLEAAVRDDGRGGEEAGEVSKEIILQQVPATRSHERHRLQRRESSHI